MLNLVAIHSDFMTTNDGVEAVPFAESSRNVRAKLQANSALAGATSRQRLRVGPQHLHHQTTLAWLPLLVPVQFPHIVQGNIVVGEQAAMQNKVLLANESRKRQCRERLGENLEDALGVFGPALSFETVHAVHVVCFVVSAVQEKCLGVEPLVCVEKKSDFC